MGMEVGLLMVMCFMLVWVRLDSWVMVLVGGVMSIRVLLVKLCCVLVVMSFWVVVWFMVFWLVLVKMLIGVFWVICCSSMLDVVKLKCNVVLGCVDLKWLLMVLKVLVRLVVVEMVSDWVLVSKGSSVRLSVGRIFFMMVSVVDNGWIV